MTRPFQIIGHRGARGLFPENTVEGFRRTIALGVRCIEIDVGVLRDGTVVVHHDLALNPDLAAMDGFYPAGSLPLLKQLTLEDVRDFAVGRIRPGSDHAARWPDQVAVDGAAIPTLAEALAVDDGVTWFIELKLMPDRPDWTVPAEEMVERVLHVVDAAGAAGRVTMQSFDWRAPRHVRAVRPEVAVAWLTSPETVADRALWWGMEHAGPVVEAVASEGGGIWTPFWETLTEAEVVAARGLGLAVVPWTVNGPADAARFRAWGVDGVITDRPDLVGAGLVG